MRPAHVPPVGLVGSVWRKLSKIALTQKRCARRWERYDHDPVTLLERRGLMID